MVAAVSVGIYRGHAVLDLDYAEDSSAETDMNIVMTETGGFVELQGTGEDGEFSKEQLNQMITLGSNWISEISLIQKVALGGS